MRQANRGRRIHRRARRAAQNHGPRHEDAANRVHRRERPDCVAVRRSRRSRAGTTFAIDSGRSGAGADAAEREIRAGRSRSRVTEVPVGGKRPTSCRRRSTDRTGPPPARSAPAHRLRRSRGPFRGGMPAPRRQYQAERRATRQSDGVDPFYGLGRIEQRGFARARPATAHIN